MLHRAAHTSLLAVLCMALLQHSCAQDISASEAPSTRKYTIEGIVINSVTGDPVAHALVVLGDHSRLMLTAADGRFQFSRLAAPTEIVFAEKPGFFDQRVLQSMSLLPPLNILDGETQEFEAFMANLFTVNGDTGPVVIKLAPEGIIAGHVQDSNSHPVRGARIRVEGAKLIDGTKSWEEKASTSSDEEGNFRIAGLMPGGYYISLRPERESSSLANLSASARLGLPLVVYYPSNPDRDTATLVKVSSGDVLELQFNVKLQPLFKVSGRILGAGADESVPLKLFDNEGSFLSAPLIPVLPNGMFEIRQIPPGRYWLRADKEGYTETSIEVTHDLEAVRLQMLPRVTIPIHVTGGPPIPEAPAVSAEQKDAQGRPRMLDFSKHADRDPPKEPVQVSFHGLEGWTTGESHDNDGPPTVSVYSGRYRVSVTTRLKGYYVASAYCGEADLLADNLVLEPGVQPKPIEVSLRDDGATLTVDVPGVNIRYSVLLVPENAPGDAVEARRGPQGDLTIPNIRPGDYQVFAFASLEELEFRNPEAMEKYSSQAVHVSLNAHQKKNLTLQLIRREE